MIEIRIKEIDPISNQIITDDQLALVPTRAMANFIKTALDQAYGDMPNYDFLVRDLDDLERELTHEERVAWFVANYYETGMELDGMTRALASENLDEFEWRGELIKFPSKLGDIKPSLV